MPYGVRLISAARQAANVNFSVDVGAAAPGGTMCTYTSFGYVSVWKPGEIIRGTRCANKKLSANGARVVDWWISWGCTVEWRG